MFTTPPATREMVQTRKQKRETQSQLSNKMDDHVDRLVKKLDCSVSEQIEKAKNVHKDEPHTSRPQTVRSKRSVSSKEAQRRKLELEAARAKAQIELKLIDKQLEADFAELNDEYSPRSEISESEVVCRTKKWVEQSKLELPVPSKSAAARSVAHELQTAAGPARLDAHELLTDSAAARHATLEPIYQRADAHEPILQLTNAIRDLVTTTTAHQQKSTLLTRLSTPRELPTFDGEPTEWLAFRQAYEESTELCSYSERENMWRLRKCLRGPARDAVASLLMGGSPSAEVMSVLELQFGNPEIILTRLMMSLKKINSLPPDYHREIVPFAIKIRNYVAAVRALGRVEYMHGTEMTTLLMSKLPPTLLSKWSDYSYKLLTEPSPRPRLEILSNFLNEEAIKTSTCAASLLNTFPYFKRKQYDQQYVNNIQSRAQTISVRNNNNNSDENCRFCRISNHNLPDCKKFKKALRKDRWFFVKRYRLCYKCLLLNHNKANCPAPTCDVDNCREPHHRLLHYVPKKDSQQRVNYTVCSDISDNHTPCDDISGHEKMRYVTSEDSGVRETVTHVCNNSLDTKVLLKTVPVSIHGPNGVVKCAALLDDGSTVSLISADLAARAGLHGHKQTMRVHGAWNSTELVCISELVKLNVSNKEGTMFTFDARTVNELDLPVQEFSAVDYVTIKQYFPEISCNEYSKPELLIGQDNYNLIVPSKINRVGELYATCTPLGWCVHGCMRAAQRLNSDRRGELHSAMVVSGGVTADAASSEPADAATSNCAQELRKLHEEVSQSFTIDSMGVGCKPRRNADDLRAEEILERTSKLIDGRWFIGIPWKDDKTTMSDSYSMALSRLKGVEYKMKKNHEYAERYNERILHLLQNDYARKLNDHSEVSAKTWYLPHFGVDNPNKKKMRLVFDAAAKSNGVCLNDYILKGPDLLASLFGIMLRFREHRIAVSADIKDMFLRVKIREEDQNAFRFLFTNPEGKIDMYLMTSLIFGANCSPFVAQFIKNKNAKLNEDQYPAAATAILNQHFMDDYLDSLPDTGAAIKLINYVIEVHRRGGFEIRGWTSNSKEVLDSLPRETLGEAAVKFKTGQQEGERTLGLVWYPSDDTLKCDVSFKRVPKDLTDGTKIPTKREMLRVIMSIFDVYGFFAPFTIVGKLMLQQTWKSNTGWDELISNEIFTKWKRWLEMLQCLDNIRIPRYYNSAFERKIQDVESVDTPYNTSSPLSTYNNLQLHMFCDASTQAMCAAAYWRWIDGEEIKVAFISSKCRVAPIKHVSVPRLELQAAVLAARLAHTITTEHRLSAEKKYFWCDSTTVLHWIRNNTRTYKTYIAHRLGEIDELTQAKEWCYVPTKLNVSDIATRDHCELSVIENEWLHGPDFLYRHESTWPCEVSPLNVEGVDLEYVTTTHMTIEYSPAVPDPERFSSWLRLLKSTCNVLSFIDKCRKLTGEIDGDMMMKAERLLIRFAQLQSFPEDAANLEQKKGLNKNSKLLTLSPFLDEHGILRVGGRIDAAPEISQDVKQPVILDGRHHISKLIVYHYHVRAAHGNREMVVNDLKQKYWIIRIRPTVKNVTSKCMICRIKRTLPTPPRMGDLPKARMAHHQRPFTNCGVDLFGPIEVTVLRRREKRYGVLFTCLTVRAIHIEVVSSLSSDAFIMALRRMAARRGWPKYLYSDNATNFRGANTELKRSIEAIDEQLLKTEALNHGTTWIFIPPASPHWGGAWERQIRSVKTSLSIVLKERAPQHETLITLLAEVENIVNSRPLTHVTVEPNTSETLTPNHFLIGSSSNLPPVGEFTADDMCLRKQWRIAQHMTDLFWRRWVREVLPEMRPRTKWLHEERPLQVGDLVLIVDPGSPRNIWPKGLVQAVMPGKDGRVRVVEVKTQCGTLRRSASRVARIPTGDEC